MKSLCLALSSVLIAAAPAYSQAMVEYGLGAGRGALAGAAAGKNTGKAVGAALDKSTKALETSGKAGPAQASASKAAKPAEVTTTAAGSAANPQAPSAAPAIDPASITPGLERRELLAKLGKPSMTMMNTDGSDLVEKLWYKSAGHETVTITLRNGKVATVTPPPAVQ